MFWGDTIAENILAKRSGKLIIRDEKTASGRVHVGSMRGVAVHGIISEVLTEKNVPHTFFYEINDFDPMDGLPVYLDQEKYRPYMGFPLYKIPSPDGVAKNFAEYFADEFKGVIEGAGFKPTYYRSSELYLSGRMNEVIRTALEHADDIRRIYKEVSGGERPPGWLPLSVVCEKCGKISMTTATNWDGEKVSYRCEENKVDWGKGCGNEGRVSPFDGNAKLPWKVEWPAKFKVMDVSVEGGGKDHSTKGGARDVANHISREVFNHEPPFDVPYEFFLVGGKKMSSSKGSGSSAKEVSDLLPSKIFRLALIGKNIMQAFNFDPQGDTIPVLFDTYDRLAEKYWTDAKDDDARLFVFCHAPEERNNLGRRFLPRFSQVAFMVQMPHLNIEEEVAKIKGEPLTALDTDELALRVRYAKIWLETEAPEEFKYEIQKELPEVARSLNENQKKSLTAILSYISNVEKLDGQELHTKLHEIRKELNIEPADFFSGVYLSILGKQSGPKAGWFLSVLNKDFLIKRLEEVSA